MTKRPRWILTRVCATDGCTESTRYEYTTRREMDTSFEARRTTPWRCVRHTRPDEVLSATNPRRETVLTCELYESGRFVTWKEIGNGFAHGPGFKAYAKDFPVGTQVRITVELVMPPENDDGSGE